MAQYPTSRRILLLPCFVSLNHYKYHCLLLFTSIFQFREVHQNVFKCQMIMCPYAAAVNQCIIAVSKSGNLELTSRRIEIVGIILFPPLVSSTIWLWSTLQVLIKIRLFPFHALITVQNGMADYLSFQEYHRSLTKSITFCHALFFWKNLCHVLNPLNRARLNTIFVSTWI